MADETPKKHAGGRPTSYSAELCEKAKDYLTTYKSTYKDEFPSVVGLCVALGRSRQTLYRWADAESAVYHEEFSDILATVADIQQQVLLNNGVNGTFNAQITKLVLGKHGYHDKQDTETTGKDGGPIENKWIVEVVDAPSTNPTKS